jgi:hypothetical protein
MDVVGEFMVALKADTATNRGDNYCQVLGSRVINGLFGLCNHLFLSAPRTEDP